MIQKTRASIESLPRSRRAAQLSPATDCRKTSTLFVMALLFLAFTALFAAVSDNRPRIFVCDSQSWESHGGFYADKSNAWGRSSGGSRPQTVEVIKNFHEHCPQVVVTMNPARADFVVVFDREGGKGLLRKDNKIALFDRLGDGVFSDSAVTVGGAVEAACRAIERMKFSRSPGDPDSPVDVSSDRAASRWWNAATPKLDGNFWRELSIDAKIALALGLQIGLELKEADIDSATDSSSSLLAASRSERKRKAFLEFNGVSKTKLNEVPTSKVVDKLNSFYDSPQNLGVSLKAAIKVVANR